MPQLSVRAVECGSMRRTVPLCEEGRARKEERMEKSQPLSFGKRALAVATSAALGLSLCAIPTQSAYAQDAMSVDEWASGTATPMCLADPDILGISSVDERWDFEGASLAFDEISNTSGGLRYLLMGSEYNEVPNPYMYNTVYETDGVKTIQNSGRDGYSVMNARRALAPYNTADRDDAIWNLLPDVIVGVETDTGTTDYSSEARGVEQALGLEANSYNPIGVANNQQSDLSRLYAIAEAGNTMAERTGKKLRYGDAVEVAKNYERYVKGAQGYVLARLAADGAQQKTFAVVTANDGNGTVTLSADYSSVYAENLQAVATNFADGLTEDTSISMTVEQLEGYADQIDLILLASDDNTGDAFVPTAGLENLFNKMYWTEDQDCGGILADNRGFDTGRNYGLILGALYPEYIDQSDWIAYYYDNVYHIKDNMVGEAIDRAMDGVRNWNVTEGGASAYVQWSAADVADYNASEVADMMDQGIEYIRSLGASAPESIQLTEYLAGASESPFSDVNVGDWFYDAVLEAADLGYVNGSDGAFRPNDDISRAETAQVLWNMEGNPAASAGAAFSDVASGDWFYGAVSWAASEGIVSGMGDGSFAPNSPVTREQVATMLYRQAGSPTLPAGTTLSGFSDADEITGYALEAMAWAVAEGIFQGNNGELRPTDSITRAELATVAIRL